MNDLSSKMKSKKELYNFLLRDGQAYLPPLGSTNVYFLKQVMRGDKDVSIQKAIITFTYSTSRERRWSSPLSRRLRAYSCRTCSSSPRARQRC